MICQTKLKKVSDIKERVKRVRSNLEKCKTTEKTIFIFDKKKRRWYSKKVHNHCNLPLCPECQGRLFNLAVKRIEKRLKKHARFKMLTLTLNKSIPKYEGKKYLIKKFKLMIKRYQRELNLNFPDYVYTYEYTYNEKTDRYHHHLHVILATPYIPYVQLERFWGEGFIFLSPETANRKGVIKYIAKYVSKFTQKPTIEEYCLYYYRQKKIIGSLLLDNTAISETEYYVYFDLETEYLTLKGIKQLLHNVSTGD